MPAVIAKCCNKILIGKSYRKNDKVFRCTTNSRKCSAISALRARRDGNIITKKLEI